MTTDQQNLSSEQKELVAVGASIGAGCHPCVAHHLKAGAKAGLDGGQLLGAVTSAERVTAEAAVLMADHAREKLGGTTTTRATLTPLEDALAAFGAALGANDASGIDLQMRAALDFGASRPQLQQAIETAQTVQENAMRIHVREAERLLDSLAAPLATPDDDIESDGCGCGADDETEATPRVSGAAGESAGPWAAMAHCRGMFDGACGEPAAAAERKESPAATVATTCSSQKEV